MGEASCEVERTLNVHINIMVDAILDTWDYSAIDRVGRIRNHSNHNVFQSKPAYLHLSTALYPTSETLPLVSQTIYQKLIEDSNSTKHSIKKNFVLKINPRAIPIMLLPRAANSSFALRPLIQPNPPDPNDVTNKILNQ